VPAQLRDELEAFYQRDHDRYREIFLSARSLLIRAPERDAFELFERAGLVRRRVQDAYAPCVRLFPLEGAFIATDLPTQREEDQVFSLMLEQLYIVSQMGVRAGDRALELCVGSGVNAVFLSDVAQHVTAVDISPRALEFARFNLALNVALNPGTEVNLLQGSLFEPLGAEEQFDYILVNPPFELVPPAAQHFHHSHGGEDGLDVVRRILADVGKHIAPGGRMELFTWSPGDEQHAVVVDLLRAAFPTGRIEVHRVETHPLDNRIRQFRGTSGFAEWRKRLLAAGHTHVLDVFVRIDAGGPAETVVLEQPKVIAEATAILEEWR
jgi:protein-L-isoaspartate O-methyltransferase